MVIPSSSIKHQTAFRMSKGVRGSCLPEHTEIQQGKTKMPSISKNVSRKQDKSLIFSVPVWSETRKRFERDRKHVRPVEAQWNAKNELAHLDVATKEQILPQWCGTVTTMPICGHSGFSAIAKQVADLKSFKVRQDIWQFLGSPRGFFQDPDLAKVMSGEDVMLARRRMLPNGIDLDFWQALDFMDSQPKPLLRLCPFDLWLVAQYVKRPVCVFFSQRPRSSCTYLPLSLSNSVSDAAIGLIQTATGWDAVSVKAGAVLPPVRLGGWGLRAREMTKTPEHKYWHDHYTFDGQQAQDKDVAGCACLAPGSKSEEWP